MVSKSLLAKSYSSEISVHPTTSLGSSLLSFFFCAIFCTFRYLLEGRFSFREPFSIRFWTVA